ncbi:MAG: hypothetical protein ISR57_07995 [Bacteroidales bacterium]|nr:hypothetical protein [Bacteroidales bacterium]
MNHKVNSHYSLRLPSILIIFLVGVLAASFWSIPAQGQAIPDTIEIPIADSVLIREHSPTKATLYSTALPGLGQIYNRKWWKVPIIYAGFGVMTYFIWSNTDEYLIYRSAYIEKVNGNTNGNYANLVSKYSEEELLSTTEYYRRNIEFSILITAVWYVLNIIDATVDAHLYTYDIDENLSLKVSPGLLPTATESLRIQPGIKLTLKF